MQYNYLVRARLVYTTDSKVVREVRVHFTITAGDRHSAEFNAVSFLYDYPYRVMSPLPGQSVFHLEYDPGKVGEEKTVEIDSIEEVFIFLPPPEWQEP